MRIHPLLFLTDQSCTFVSETLDFKVKGGCRVSNGVIREAQRDLGKTKVPVVCLERLKILVSQIPPHGRRQSDPLPASGTDKSENVTRQRTWNDEVCLYVCPHSFICSQRYISEHFVLPIYKTVQLTSHAFKRSFPPCKHRQKLA